MCGGRKLVNKVLELVSAIEFIGKEFKRSKSGAKENGVSWFGGLIGVADEIG